MDRKLRCIYGLQDFKGKTSVRLDFYICKSNINNYNNKKPSIPTVV